MLLIAEVDVYKFLETSRMSSHAMFVPEASTVTLWNSLEHSTE